MTNQQETDKDKEDLSKIDIIALNILSKSCPRCGGKSANSSNPSGRCSSCLNKLARSKKTPGHWQRAQTKADDALRRQKGKAGGHPTAKGTSRGNGTRKEIVSKIKRAEKKTGQKLSPDRKDNDKGYSSSNVRAVPEHLNRGRHNVDRKKLKEWRKRLKKSEDLNKINLKNIANAGAAAATSLLGSDSALETKQNKTNPSTNISISDVDRIKPGEMVNSYKDPRFRIEEKQLEEKMNIPNGFLAGLRLGGERSNADQVSSKGAKGVYQFTPNSRKLYLKKYGVDAWKSSLDSILAAAHHAKESLNWAKNKLGIDDSNHPDVAIQAMRHYNGGPDTSIWGPQNRQYGPRAFKAMLEVVNSENLEKKLSEWKDKLKK